MASPRASERFLRYADDPVAFRADAPIKAGHEYVRRGDVAEQFQLDDEQAMDPAWLALSGAGAPVARRFAYLERPRGHSKTTDAALAALHPLIFSSRRLHGVIASGDVDQAKIDLRQMALFAEAMPWIGKRFTVQARSAVNKQTGSLVECISSDVATSWGIIPDFVICDELTAWPASGESMFYSLYSSVEKQAHCVLMIISNAGFGMGESWQWKVRQEAIDHPAEWYVNSLPGPTAKWLTRAQIERQRRMLPPHEFDRVVMNRWTENYSELLTNDEIDNSIDPKAGPLDRAEPGSTYICGIDIGIARDKTAVVVVAKRGSEYRLANIWSWAAPKGGKVSLAEVQATVIAAHKRYRFTKVAVDPWNAAKLVEDCKAAGVPIEERPQSGKNLVDQCMTMLDAFRSNNFRMYPHDGLLYDLRHLKVETRSYGSRLVSPKDGQGHGDIASATSICLAAARSIQSNASRTWGGVINSRPGTSRASVGNSVFFPPVYSGHSFERFEL